MLLNSCGKGENRDRGGGGVVGLRWGQEHAFKGDWVGVFLAK